jgi:hypothetical protein
MGSACSIHGKKRNAYMITVEKPEEKSLQEDLDVYCRREYQDGVLWTGSVWLGIETVGGLL